MRHHNQLTSIFLSVLLVSASWTARAQTTNTTNPPSTEDRLNKLENKMDKLMDLLEQQQAQKAPGGASPATPGATAPAAAPTTPTATAPGASTAGALVPGPILHIYSLPTSRTNEDLPDGPPNDTGEIAHLVDSTDLFRAGRLTEEKELQEFSNSFLGFLWSGDLILKKGGQTVVIFETEFANNNWCQSKAIVSVGGTEVTRLDSRDGRTPPVTAQLNLPLGPRVYKMDVWICAGARSRSLVGLNWRMKVKEEGDPFARIITKDDFTHHER